MTVQIPEEIRKKIEDEASKSSLFGIFPINSTVNVAQVDNNKRDTFIKGAVHGYSLSKQQLEEKDKEIAEYSRNLTNAADRCGSLTNDIYQLRKQLSSFREKLSNITVDELLKNTGIVIKLFDEEFKL